MKKFLLALVLMVPMLAFTGCGNDDEPNVSNQILNVGQAYTIPADGSWTSDNDLIASVDGKTVKGVRMGEVTIRNGDQSFSVVVNPTITLYPDPCLQFGDSPSSIKNFMNKYGYEFEESATNITYASLQNGSVVGHGYTFENSKLTMSMILAQRSIASTERMAEYLNQRFVPVTHNDDYIGLVSPDKTILVVFTIRAFSGNIMYVTSYAPYTNSTNSRSDSFDTAFEEIINATPGELVIGGMK